MSNTRVWLFRILILAAAGLMLVSWFKPWWGVEIYELYADVVVIRPWGLENFIPAAYMDMIEGSDMPGWFGVAMWAYLGLGIAALLFAALFRDRKIKLFGREISRAKFIIGLVGFSYIVVVVLALIIAAIRTGDFWNLKVSGITFIELTEAEYSDALASWKLGYWLACAVGPLLIVLALLRNKIIGKRLLK